MRKPSLISLQGLLSGSTLPPYPSLIAASVFKDLPALSYFTVNPDGQPHINTHALETPAGCQDEFVTVELVTKPSSTETCGKFERLEIPWSAYLSFLASPPPQSSQQTLYLAQQAPPRHLLPMLTLPIGDQASAALRTRTAKTSMWLGFTPTTTPLHRDPDSNVLCQLVGSKTVRLCAPEQGQHILDRIRGSRSNRGFSNRMRGEEMMRPGPGGERDALESAVWDTTLSPDHWWEATIERGQGLYIPQGWWHAVRSRSRTGRSAVEQPNETLNASVNWWFR